MDSASPHYSDDSIDFAELWRRIRLGLSLSLGLALVGLALGIIISLLATSKQDAVSTLRVSFGFPGFERGTYPNGTKFQPDDIRAPDVVNDAIKHLNPQNSGADLSSKIRGAIGISGIVSPNITKERDRLRATGQILPPYIPDEYEVSLSLSRDYSLSVRQRELLLTEIINAYLEKFRRTYVALPAEFDSAFSSLKNADFAEYELILTKETQVLISFLEQKAENAKQFRSPNNNLSFQDLLKQAELFSQTRLNDVLGQIYINGLSRDRNNALVKMDYYLRTLEDREQRLKEEEAVVINLLTKTQERAQNYVLAAKTQVPQGSQPMMDQGFIDSLLANDAYNFLIRKALDAGLAVKRVEAEKAQLLDRRQRMDSFAKGKVTDQTAAIASTKESLASLETSYQELLTKVRTCLDDDARQEFGDAVRISQQAKTSSVFIILVIGAIIGSGIGLSLGLGLSLIRQVPAANAP